MKKPYITYVQTMQIAAYGYSVTIEMSCFGNVSLDGSMPSVGCESIG